MFAK
jgi:hypothetical protein